MIDALVADLLYPRAGGLRAVCGPLSLALDCPSNDSERLLADADPVIWTILEIDGDRVATPVLVGFASEERRRLYENLRALPGIGRRSALMVLDCGENLDILRAVSAGDKEFFRQVPGLGSKRIDGLIANLRKSYEAALPRPLHVPVAVWVEARSALESRGMPAAEAERLLADAEGANAEQLLEAVL